MAATLPPRHVPLRLPRICVAITAIDGAEMVAKAESIARDNFFIEFRLDYLKQPAAAILRLRKFLEAHGHILAIATCRRARNGGKFRGSAAAQVDVLTKAANAGCQMVDLELESAQQLKPALVAKLRTQAALILSFHDFRATRKLHETYEKMRQVPADYYKLVSTATSLSDNVTMMKFLQEKSDRESVIGLCMGEQGIISRVLGVRAGSAFTFAAATVGEETAPGQIAARTLRDTYRIESVDAATRVYGVAGDPIEHSLSPAMMNAAFRRENVNAVYLALHAKSLPDLMTCVREIPLHGLSVTMPYKQAILKELDNTDALTGRVGACNTVVRGQEGNLYGFNTDVAGIVRPLELRLPLPGARVLVIGAGGAARAAVFALKERQAEVSIVDRTAAKAQKLAHQAHARFVQRSALRKLAFDVIINATPVGMGASRQSPLDEKELNAKFVFDMVYSPLETRFIKMARAKGLQVITGDEMFVHQAARQFEIWTGKPAPIPEMMHVVQTALASSPPVEKAEAR
jgi:3-dehydroquinate dehydratase/shikimate dehydrogenase